MKNVNKKDLVTLVFMNVLGFGMLITLAVISLITVL